MQQKLRDTVTLRVFFKIYIQIFTMIVQRNLKFLYDVYAAYLAFLNLMHICKCAKRRIWTREIYTEHERLLHGFHNTVFKTMKSRDHEQFFKLTRMSPSLFDLLLNLIELKLTKHSPRKPINAECRLLVTLMYVSCSFKTDFQ